MKKTTLDLMETAEAMAAELPSGLDRSDYHRVSIDSRDISEGTLFIGLPGEKTHGQRFAASALDGGAAAVVVEDLDEAQCREKGNVLLVESCERALQSAARAVREKSKAHFVGVTGSCGKTTTKDVLARVLDEVLAKTHASLGNFNNHLGLPLSLLSMPRDVEWAVLELAMSNPGEIDLLASILKPSVGIITNIGEAHLETMGTIERIFEAKAELIPYLSEDGILMLNGDCPFAEKLRERCFARVLDVGISPNKARRCFDAELSEIEIRFNQLRGRLFIRGSRGERDFGFLTLPVAGSHIARSFLFAALLAWELGAEEDALVSSLQEHSATWGRMAVESLGSVKVINDAYNANPSSMEAALRYLAALPSPSFAVLGEMLELGEHSHWAHEKVARLACGLLGEDRVLFLGECYRPFEGEFPKARFFDSIEDIAEGLSPILGEGDTLLLKASRGVGLEAILPKLFRK